MRVVYSLLLLLVAPLGAFAHTEFFIPKIFSLAELPTAGFAFLNPDPIPANLEIFLISGSGVVVSNTKRTIEAGGQLAQLGTDLFPKASGAGWVYLRTDTEGLQAFWLVYDTGLTFLDGAAAPSYDDGIGSDGIGNDQILPFAGNQIELNVVNPNFSRVVVTIRLFGSQGELAPGVTRDLVAVGALQAQVSELFPAVDINQARYVRVQTAGTFAPSIASSVLIRGFLVPKELAVINGQTVTLQKQLIFPHVISGPLGGANYVTTIGIANLALVTQTLTFTFTPDRGEPVRVTRPISAAGFVLETAQALFGFPAEFQNGWVSVTGSSAISGFLAFADQTAGSLATVAPAIAQKNLFFSHIADGPPQWQTGIALLNSTDTTAAVEMFAVTTSGRLIGSAQFALEPGKKVARAIHEWIPEARGVNGGFIYVRTSNNVALSGIELFYTEDLKVLSNVPAARLVGGIKYVPPSL